MCVVTDTIMTGKVDCLPFCSMLSSHCISKCSISLQVDILLLESLQFFLHVFSHQALPLALPFQEPHLVIHQKLATEHLVQSTPSGSFR
jgi:hypothetical protein